MNKNDKIWTVYVHIIPKEITNYDHNKYYIGITGRDVRKRWGSNGSQYKEQIYFYRAIQKYGWDNIKHIVLIEDVSKVIADECEKYLIAKYQTNNPEHGYNITQGGDGVVGYKFSEEQCRQRSLQMKGHEISEETRRKIGEANKIALKGKTLPIEVRKKISEKNKGKKHPHTKEQDLLQSERLKGNKLHLGYKASDESRKRMSDAHKGLPLTEAQLANLKRLHEANKGKPRSEATKQKLREAHLGKKRGPWTDAERKAHMESNERRRKEKLKNSNI